MYKVIRLERCDGHIMAETVETCQSREYAERVSDTFMAEFYGTRKRPKYGNIKYVVRQAR